ncbi:hypothetical protein L7F22_003848 [Adiantum nelumboides]|nr:hypothetical protein [Adiantum nelumboides]
MFSSLLFPFIHEHVKLDQGGNAVFNPVDECVYENPPFDVGHKNQGVTQGDFSPVENHLANPGQNHSADLEDDTDGPSVAIPVSELENWYCQLQGGVIIGLYHGVRPSLEALRTWISQTWEKTNIRINHVQYLPNGYYLLCCDDSNSALQTVSQGQWLIRNTPISVFNRYIGFNPKGPKPTKAPVWVDFVDLPIELYPWLKPIGNSLGRVIGQRSRGGINPKFDPQLLIEIDLSKDLKYLIPIKDSCGRPLHQQKIVYKNLPNACFNCMKLCHFIKECPDLKPQSAQPAPDPEKKYDFHPVGRRNAPRPFKINRASSSRNRNSFSPLLEDVFDPLDNATAPSEPQRKSKMDVAQEEVQKEYNPNDGQDITSPKVNVERIPINSSDVFSGASSASSSDGEEDSILNTQAVDNNTEEGIFEAQL